MKVWNKVQRKVRDDNERGAREAILEELFNDLNRSRFTIYKLNFFRGIFFGLGSVLGATVVLAIVIWLLNLTGHLIPGIADFINQIVDVMQSGRK